jgi:hypothetical protein
MQQRNFYLQRMNRFLRRSPSNGSDRSSELPRPSLTISRQCGTRCNEIRRKLVEYLDSITPSVTHGWACFGQCVIGKLIEDRRLDGVGPSFSEKTFNFQSLEICRKPFAHRNSKRLFSIIVREFTRSTASKTSLSAALHRT